MATLEETTKVMAYLIALWPREPIEDPTIKAYHTVLKDIPNDALTAAAEKVAADATFFPRAAELRQAAFNLMQGDDLPLAIEAWQQVATTWTGRKVEFHALTQATVRRMGGMRRLGQTQEKELPFVRAQFIKTFEALRAREVEDRRMLPAVRAYKELAAENRAQDEIKRLAAMMAGNNGNQIAAGRVDTPGG